jgi:hypothetical protein
MRPELEAEDGEAVNHVRLSRFLNESDPFPSRRPSIPTPRQPRRGPPAPHDLSPPWDALTRYPDLALRQRPMREFLRVHSLACSTVCCLSVLPHLSNNT